MFTEIKSQDGMLTGHQNNDTGELFRRFEAGLYFSGFCVVIGEKHGSEDGPKPLKVLAEAQESSLHELVKRIGTLQELYPVRSWLCDQEGDNAGHAKLFREFAQELDVKVSLTQPSLPSDLDIALQVIRRRLKQRTLLFPKDGILAGKIEALARTDPREAKAEDFPEVVVLGAVIHRLDSSSGPVKSYIPSRPPSAMSA